MIALPFVARLGPEDVEPASNAGLTSVGIDLGAKLSSWNTQLVEVLWFELNDSGTDRPFLVTARIPEHGRSGGGLFDNKRYAGRRLRGTRRTGQGKADGRVLLG